MVRGVVVMSGCESLHGPADLAKAARTSLPSEAVQGGCHYPGI